MGYIQDFIIYMGSRTSIESQHNDIRKSKSVVMSFLEQCVWYLKEEEERNAKNYKKENSAFARLKTFYV
ncbi:piggyBac transposable element-derived protein 4-like [Vespula maculifrons]|uniref:PiggyBac transposable element-derived protein 4-like n=1 Tax=Vespula maculifrons TaxID=7453 RepID=A0ABD2ASK2_VESMC